MSIERNDIRELTRAVKRLADAMQTQNERQTKAIKLYSKGRRDGWLYAIGVGGFLLAVFLMLGGPARAGGAEARIIELLETQICVKILSGDTSYNAKRIGKAAVDCYALMERLEARQ